MESTEFTERANRFLIQGRGTPSVAMKRVRNGLNAKEMGSCRCVDEAVRNWKQRR